MSVLGNLYSYIRRVFTVSAPGKIEAGMSSAGARVEAGDVLALSSAYACVRLLSGTIASLPLGVFRETSSGHSEPMKDHPLWRILHRAPNPEQTAFDFWSGGAASFELRGNILARKNFGSNGQIAALTPMAWDLTTIWRGDDGELRYKNGEDELTASDVLHIRGFGGGPEGGLSTISLACETFGIAKAINQAAGKTFANGVATSGVLSADRDIPAEKMTEAQRLIEEKYVGAVNAGRPLILNNGLKWQSISINPNDAQMLESRAFSVEEVCRIFGVPPHMVGHTEKNSSWGTGIEQQTLAFQKFTLRARLKCIETALEQQLLTPDDIAKGISIQFNLEGLLRGDSAGRTAFYSSGLQNGWLTINEVRAKEGMPPVAGGDVPRMQMQNVPITEAGNLAA